MPASRHASRSRDTARNPIACRLSYWVVVFFCLCARTWVDRLLLWQRAYETRIFDAHREVIGRGPTPEASQKAAERKWDTKLPVEEK